MFVNNCLQSQNQKNEEREGRVGDVRLKLLQQMRGFSQSALALSCLAFVVAWLSVICSVAEAC